MHCTLLIPDLLPPREPGDEPASGLHVTSVETILARGSTSLHPALACEEWLSERFRVPRQQDTPLAAMMLKADGGEPGPHYWLCADPIQLRVDRSRLVIASRAADFTAMETRDLIAALNRHFSADGVEFCAPVPSRWYVRCASVPRLVTTPLAHALNRSVKHHLPQGDDALDWHRIMNEAQMILHNHPVTAAREARGATAANSIWLWGGGTLPALSNPSFDATWGGGHLVRAFATAAGIACHDLPAHGAAWLEKTRADRHLLAFDAPAQALREGGAAAWREQVEKLNENWMRPLLAALKAKQLSGIELMACNDEGLLRTIIAPADLWRFWRRARPLAAYAGKG